MSRLSALIAYNRIRAIAGDVTALFASVADGFVGAVARLVSRLLASAADDFVGAVASEMSGLETVEAGVVGDVSSASAWPTPHPASARLLLGPSLGTVASHVPRLVADATQPLAALLSTRLRSRLRLLRGLLRNCGRLFSGRSSRLHRSRLRRLLNLVYLLSVRTISCNVPNLVADSAAATSVVRSSPVRNVWGSPAKLAKITKTTISRDSDFLGNRKLHGQASCK